MEGVFRFKTWFLNAPELIHGGAYYQNFMLYQFKFISLHTKASHFLKCIWLLLKYKTTGELGTNTVVH